MNELQQAAKLLNENAPVDGPLGKERIVYVNELEENILKSLGGSGDIIIPEEGTPSYSQTRPTQSRVLPEGYAGITSFRAPIPNTAPRKNRNWWEEFKDDVLGIDDSKFFGIKKHTALGKALHKVGDTFGFNENRTLGIKDSTVGDIAKSLAPFIPVYGWAAWAAMNAYEVNEAIENADKFQDGLASFGHDFTTSYDPRNYTGLRYANYSNLLNNDNGIGVSPSAIIPPTKEERAQQRGTGNMENIQKRINAVPSYSLTTDDASRSTNQAIVTNQQGAGKAPIFNTNDTGRVNSYFAAPGDEGYVEGFSKGGQYNTPYPDYLENSKQTILGDIDEAGKYFEDYQGTSDERMYNYQPILDKLKGMNLDLISSAGSIFDKGEGGLENRYKNYNTLQDNLSNQLKELNLLTGADNQKNLDSFANNLINASDTEVGLTNLGFDSQRGGAMAQNRQAMNLANAGLRNLNSLSSSGTGKTMSNAMIGARLGQEMADNIANVEANRYSRLAEINPAKGDLLAAEARMKYGDQNLAASAANIGVDQAMIDDDKALDNDILNARLGNAGLIDYLGSQAASLPGLQLEAALAPLNPLMQYTAPYSQVNGLPAPTTGYSPTPSNNDPEWYDYVNAAPDILNNINAGLDSGGEILDRFFKKG